MLLDMSTACSKCGEGTTHVHPRAMDPFPSPRPKQRQWLAFLKFIQLLGVLFVGVVITSAEWTCAMLATKRRRILLCFNRR